MGIRPAATQQPLFKNLNIKPAATFYFNEIKQAATQQPLVTKTGIGPAATQQPLVIKSGIGPAATQQPLFKNWKIEPTATFYFERNKASSDSAATYQKLEDRTSSHFLLLWK